MMPLKVRKAADRGKANFGWLDSKHTFSFGHYNDPDHMGFGPLRVINDDRVAGGGGFPTHPHADMEIISYVVTGALEHQDSIGTGSVIKPGDVQRMSAGTGIRHSEFNASKTDPVHFLQIWIVPETRHIEPGYEQKSFEAKAKRGKLRLVGSRQGRDGSITIHQRVDMFAGLFKTGERAVHQLAEGRAAWLQIARGTVALNGVTLSAGDGASMVQPGLLTLDGLDITDAEVLLFDLAA